MGRIGVMGTLLGVAVVAGCSNAGELGLGGGKVCTDIGCSDQFHVRVANSDGSFTPGTHVLEVTVDGVLLSCTFALPPETAAGGAIASPACPTGLQVFAGPLTTCTTSSNGTSTSQTCTPIAGTIQEEITVNGTPAALRLRQTAGGVVVFDHDVAPSYRSVQPNGPGCGPVCRQSSVEWAFVTP